MVREGLTIAATARRLGLPDTTANEAYRTGKAMTEQGLEDAYGMVESMPARPDVFEATSVGCEFARSRPPANQSVRFFSWKGCAPV